MPARKDSMTQLTTDIPLDRVSKKQKRRATLVVCEKANDAADARVILEALGLL